MASFTAQVFQNEFLPADGTEVHAIVTVTCTGSGDTGDAGDAGDAGAAGEIIIVDTSGSMETPASKIRAARVAAAEAVGEIADGTWFAVIAGASGATVVYPEQGRGMVQMDERARREALFACEYLTTGGGTAIGSWLTLAGLLFRSSAAVRRHAILLTDGANESETPEVFERAVRGVTGVFQCDCRGVGEKWVVDELRFIATELLGTVDLVADDPQRMGEDFAQMMQASRGRGIAAAELRVWTPVGSQVLFVRQVAPTIEDLTPKRVTISDLIGGYPTGSWGDESRDYHVAVRVPAKSVGAEQLAARVMLAVDEATVAQGLVKAAWSDDDQLTTRINPAVAHYTGQTELAAAIQEGLAAKAGGDEATATIKLGRAVQLAAATGNEEATTRLKKVVDVVDLDTGTVRLKRDASKLDEMALDTRSTKTTRVRSK